MIGIRTPTKKTTDTMPANKSPPKPAAQEPGTSAQQKVRRSVGEWEAGIGETRKLATPPKTALPSNIKKAQPLPRTESPPLAVGNKNVKTEEARKCLVNLKFHLGMSKNMKKEIKDEVLKNADRLYQITKEVEMEAGKASTVGTKTSARNQAPLPSPRPSLTQGSRVDETLRTEIESFKKALEEHTRKLLANTGKMDELKEVLQASQTQNEHSSYASAAASQIPKSPLKKTTLHSIAVSTEDEKTTGEAVLAKIREAVQAKDEWVKVERIRKTKNRKIIMSFQSEEEKNKVQNRLKSRQTDLTIEEVKNRDPLLVLKDVLSINSNEDIVKALRNQNQEIFRGINKEEDRIQVKYRKRARNPHTGHVVISTSATVWRRIIEKGHAYIDLQRVRAEDQSPLLQCSLCLGYGHSRKLCTETAEKCSHCGGPHMKRNCTEWLADATPTCCNCVQAKNSRTDHNAFSNECTVRKRWDSIARAAIAYC